MQPIDAEFLLLSRGGRASPGTHARLQKELSAAQQARRDLMAAQEARREVALTARMPTPIWRPLLKIATARRRIPTRGRYGPLRGRDR